MTTKLCKDCKFYAKTYKACNLPSEGLKSFNLLTGEEQVHRRLWRCCYARASNDPLECGPEARHFQPSLTYRVVTFFKRVVP